MVTVVVETLQHSRTLEYIVKLAIKSPIPTLRSVMEQKERSCQPKISYLEYVVVKRPVG